MTPASPVRVEIFHNATEPQPGLPGVRYQPGHRLIPVFAWDAATGPSASRPAMRGTPAARDVAEIVLVISGLPPGDLNPDEAAFARYSQLGLRPVRPGDLVRVGDVTLACEPSGWTELPGPGPAGGVVPAAPPALAVLIGPAGSGKSTAAAQGWDPSQVLGIDDLRCAVAGDPYDHAATWDAVSLLLLRLRDRLRRRLATVIDAASVTAAERAPLLAAAAEFQVPAFAIVLGTPLQTCLDRNARRPGPAPGTRWSSRVSDDVIRRQHRQMQDSLPGLRAEGFTAVATWPGWADDFPYAARWPPPAGPGQLGAAEPGQAGAMHTAAGGTTP